MFRPSAYRSHFYSVSDPVDYVSVSTETEQNKEAEKDKMVKLNNRLVNYVDRVHDLELANKSLTAENARLQSLKQNNEDDDDDYLAVYKAELKRLRSKVELVEGHNTKLEIDLDNRMHQYKELEEKMSLEVKRAASLDLEVANLRKDMEDAAIDRRRYESRIESLQDAMKLEKQVHATEMENLQEQIQPLDAPLLMASEGSIVPDLNDAILSVRKQYDDFNSKSLADLDAFYKEKVEGLTKQWKNSLEDSRNLRVEIIEKKRAFRQLEVEIENLKLQVDRHERTIEELNERLAREDESNQALIVQINQELDSTKQDLGKYLIDYQRLNSLNLSLEQEISIYQKVLSGEEERISEFDIGTASTVSSHSKIGTQNPDAVTPPQPESANSDSDQDET